MALAAAIAASAPEAPQRPQEGAKLREQADPLGIRLKRSQTMSGGIR